MPSKFKSTEKYLKADPRFKSNLVGKFINNLMVGGKKTLAQRVFYKAIDEVVKKVKDKDPLEIFTTAINNIKPHVEVRSRRVGGATYQVPVEVRPDRRQALAIRWLIEAARKRNENTMTQRLAGEIMDAASNRGNAVKKREDTHRMADANKAFAHYRW
mgnify:CR=1 FL=1